MRGHAQSRPQLVVGDFLALQEFDGQRLVGFGDPFDHRLTGRFNGCNELIRDGDFLRIGAEALGEAPRLAGDQIDHAGEQIFGADGVLHGHGFGAQTIANHVDRAPEIGAGAVHLIDKADARHAVTIRLPPHRLRLRLDACDCIEDHDAAIQHAQAALHFRGEIDVAGRVDQVDLVAAPLTGDRRRLDRDPALALLHHPIGDGGTFIDIAHPIGSAGVVEDALGGGGFARVDMRDDADVAQSPQTLFIRR